MGGVGPAAVPAQRVMIDDRFYGLIELVLVFGLILGWAFWQWWDWWRWKQRHERQEGQEGQEGQGLEQTPDRGPGSQNTE